MAPPLLGIATDEDLTSNIDEGTVALLTLADCSAEERKRIWKRTFARQVEPLLLISLPSQCDEFPQFSKEIVAAYLKHTTFTIKVWANYDAFAKKFYLDLRSKDCGKLNLSPRQRKYLKDVNPKNNMELERVRLEIGTAFKTLCRVDVRAISSKLYEASGIKASISSASEAENQHPHLFKFVQEFCDVIEDFELPGRQRGFKLPDIVEIASMLKRKPTAEEIQDRKFFIDADHDPWMDVTNDNENNPGWLDFEALGKSCCISGCDGCQGRQKSRFWYSS